MQNEDPIFCLKNEIILITGACGQLGMQYVEMLLNRSAKVVAMDLFKNEIIEILNNKYKDNFMFCQTDVTSKISLLRTLDTIVKSFGTPTVLINNAAIDSPPSAPISENGPFEDYPEESWDKVMNVNLKGVFLCCQIFGGAMAQNQKGSIINISSIYGIVSPDQNLYNYKREKGEIFYKPVAYSASKSGLINLTKYLAVYWASKKVRVNSLVISGVFNNQDDGFLKAYTNRIPIGRMANIDEYNGALIFLASSASKYMTGSNLIVDGGWTAI